MSSLKYIETENQPKCRGLSTFGLIGLAFMLVEIPLTQRYILFLGHPAYAMAAVLFTILTASGIGSLLAHKFNLRHSLIVVVCMGIVSAVGFEILQASALSYPLPVRVLTSGILLFPLGAVMGMPFSQAIKAHKLNSPRCIAYAWSVNGALSVVSSVLAAFLALTADFRFVYIIGLCCYGAAVFTAPKVQVENPPPLRR